MIEPFGLSRAPDGNLVSLFYARAARNMLAPNGELILAGSLIPVACVYSGPDKEQCIIVRDGKARALDFEDFDFDERSTCSH